MVSESIDLTTSMPDPRVVLMLDRLIAAGECAGAGRDVFIGEDSRLTWGGLSDALAKTTAGLAAVGVRRGSGVAIATDRFDDEFLGILAAWIMGATAAPLNLTLPDQDLQSIVDTLRPTCVWAGGRPNSRRLHLPTGEPRLFAGAGLVMFTSGSTGVPKGVVLAIEQLLENARTVVRAVDLGPGDRLFVNTPPYYMSAFCHFLAILTAGGTFVGRSGFHFGSRLLEELAGARATVFGGAPVHLARALAGSSPGAWPPELRLWLSSGDHMAEETLVSAADLAPRVRHVVMYGLTEVAGRLCLLDDAAHSPYRGSVGRPLGGMRIVVRDATGREVRAGIEGDVYVHGPMLMTGYLDETRPSVTPYGFRTGDVGHCDADGNLWLTGRSDDVFKSSGEKVSSIRVEREVAKLPGVADAAVIVAPDPVVGKCLEAFVVLIQGAMLTPRDVIRCLRGVLPASHIPRRVTFVESLPRTGSGKIRKGQIRSTIKNQAGEVRS